MTNLFKTIVDLVRLGNLGVGVAILLLGFVLAIQAKPADQATAKLRSDFLKVGVAYAALTAVIGLVPLFVRGAPTSERVAFSPDFETEKLRPPTIRLPDGTVTQHDVRFELQPSSGTQVLTVTMDATLKQVRDLRQTSANLTSAVAKVTEQRDKLALRAASGQRISDTQPTLDLQALRQASASSVSAQSDLLHSLNAGDFAKANALATRLQTSASAVDPAVAVLTAPK